MFNGKLRLLVLVFALHGMTGCANQVERTGQDEVKDLPGNKNDEALWQEFKAKKAQEKLAGENAK